MRIALGRAAFSFASSRLRVRMVASGMGRWLTQRCRRPRSVSLRGLTRAVNRDMFYKMVG
jgi:hypothetical protein